MSQAIRELKLAVGDFANRAREEDIDPRQLRDVIDELEGELEWLCEPVADRARLRAEDEASMEEVIRSMGLSVTPPPKP